MNDANISQLRPKLTLRKPVPVNDSGFWFVWVVGRRGPRQRLGSAQEALSEAKRLRKLLGPDFTVKTYQAVEVTNGDGA